MFGGPGGRGRNRTGHTQQAVCRLLLLFAYRSSLFPLFNEGPVRLTFCWAGPIYTPKSHHRTKAEKTFFRMEPAPPQRSELRVEAIPLG